MSERRHRLYSHEIPEIIEGLRLRLMALLEKREEPERAEVAFRAFYRLERMIVGRPKYPEFSWARARISTIIEILLLVFSIHLYLSILFR